MSRRRYFPERDAECHATLVAKAAEYRRRESEAAAAGNASHVAHWRCFAEEYERHALRYARPVLVSGVR